MRTTLVLFCLGIAGPALLAQAPEEAKLLTVRGWGTVQSRPDLALFTFRVSSGGQSAQEAEKLQRGKVAAVVAALHKVLSPEITLSEGHLAFFDPQPGWVVCTSLLEFTLTHVDTLSLEDLGLHAAQLIDTATRAGADNSAGFAGTSQGPASPVRFQVTDTAGMHQKALKAAIADARSRAESIAAEAGLKVGRIHALEEVVPRGAPVTALRAEGDNSGSFEVSVEVTVSLELE